MVKFIKNYIYWAHNPEAAGSNPVPATNIHLKPFGQLVKGLSHYRFKGYTVKRKVQTRKFEDKSFFSNIRCNPFILQCLGKFKRFIDQIAHLRTLPPLPLQPDTQKIALFPIFPFLGSERSTG